MGVRDFSLPPGGEGYGALLALPARRSWRGARLQSKRAPLERRVTLTQLRLGSKLPSLRNPLPSRERGSLS